MSAALCEVGVEKSHGGREGSTRGRPNFGWLVVWNTIFFSIQLWPWLLVITGYFYGIKHSINGVISTYNW